VLRIRIRCLFDPWIRDPGWVKNRIRDEQPGSYFRELRKPILWDKILKLFADPGWKKIGSGIQDGKHSDPRPGINIPDPQHCSYYFFFLGLLLHVWLEKTTKNSFIAILIKYNLAPKYRFHEP
jgi:hypothetical protein